MIVDAHFHLWRIGRGDYGWMDGNPDVAAIRRDYAPADFPGRALGIDRAVIVQAAPTVAETDYLLALADATDWIARVVGWVDFENLEDRAALERLARHPKFAGVRPMIQDIPDLDWMHRADIQWGFDAVRDLGLTFDALGYPAHIENFLRLFERYPDMATVIDHCMKPRIRDGAFDGWAAGMERIARETPVNCKLSGLFNEAAPGATAADLRPYAEHLLAVFGPDRLIWGSDWPVVTLNGSYAGWLAAARSFVPPAAQAAVFGGTATRFYNIHGAGAGRS